MCARTVARVAPKPATLTFERAAAVPLAAHAPLLGLRDRGQLQPGQTVLINGAAGGAGTFAVQIAKALGAQATAVFRARNADPVSGADTECVVDYATADSTAGDERYDLILDLVANRSPAQGRRALTTRGTLVVAAPARQT